MSTANLSHEHLKHLLTYVGIWTALGLEISWNKVVRGRNLNWIGFNLELCGPQGHDLQIQLAEAKRDKLLATLDELQGGGCPSADCLHEIR